MNIKNEIYSNIKGDKLLSDYIYKTYFFVIKIKVMTISIFLIFIKKII